MKGHPKVAGCRRAQAAVAPALCPIADLRAGLSEPGSAVPVQRQDAKLVEPSTEHDLLAHEFVEAAFVVPAALGPGLLETAYEPCLTGELEARSVFGFMAGGRAGEGSRSTAFAAEARKSVDGAPLPATMDRTAAPNSKRLSMKIRYSGFAKHASGRGGIPGLPAANAARAVG